MNVLHVTPSISRSYGGPTYSLAAYARASTDANVRTTIAAPRAAAGDAWLTSMLPEVEVHQFRHFGRGAFFAAPELHSWLRRSGSTFDVVHVHGLLNPVSSLAARTCVRNGWPLVIRPFGTMSRYTLEYRRGALKRVYSALLDNANLRRSSAVHFTTVAERVESKAQVVTSDERAFVIPPPWIGEILERREERPDAQTVLFLSRLHPVKCLELLLEAWPLVRERIAHARLLIAGDGDAAYVREMNTRAARLGDSVQMLGHVDGAYKRVLLGDADLFVLPSLHENFGISVLEAMAAGLPVVVTPEVQLADFIAHQSLGLVTQRSAPALADSIMSALGDRELIARCRNEGAEIVRAQFSVKATGERLSQMYQYAAAHPPV